MKLIWYGTAAIALESGGQRILFDPFVPLHGSPVDMTLADYDGYDTIFVTHGHVDHIVSLPDVCSRNPNAVVHCTDTPWHTLRGKGVPEHQLRLIGYDQTIQLGPFIIRTLHGRHAVLPKITPALLLQKLATGHWGNLPFLLRENRICQENDETLLYHIEAEGKSIVLMGSLNLRPDAAYPTGCDVLLLPYNGWEDNLPPAVDAIERLQPKRVLLHHYDDTFPPLTGPIDRAPIKQRYPGLVEDLTLKQPITL